MRIDYCPKCNKAGLKYDDPMGKDFEGRTSKERFEIWKQGGFTDYGYRKWCPRCNQWVMPIEQEKSSGCLNMRKRKYQ